MYLALLAMLMLFMLAVPGLAMLVGVGVLLVLPAYLMFSSVFTVILAPQQFLAVATDKTTRRNHSCEHATVNVLEELLGPLPGVGGVATKDGFYIWGAEGLHPSVLADAARTGLRRMKLGERALAIHARCGTSLLMGRFVFAVAFLVLLVTTGYLSLLNVAIALVASWFLGKPLGALAQRYATTSPDVGPVQLVGLSWENRPQIGPLGALSFRRGAYFFHTL